MSIDEIKKFNLEERIILMNNVCESFESTEIIISPFKWDKEFYGDNN
jgi:hypothetical protein